MVSIDSSLWGASAWSLLHYIGFHSKASLETLRDLFEDLKRLLPCAQCRYNYENHLKAIPFPTRREAVSKWVYRLHDRVNRAIQPSSMVDTPSWKEVQTIWLRPEGHRRAQRESWRFLFLLAQSHPERHSTHRKAFETALGLWMHEVATTLFHTSFPTGTERSKERLTRWLKDHYQRLHGVRAPSTLTQLPTTECAQQCKAPQFSPKG